MPLLAPATNGQAAGGAPNPVVVIVLENHSYASVVGNPNAPFINGTLLAGGLLEQQFYSVYPNSGENYLAMTAGITDTAAAPAAPNLFGSLPSTLPWRTFEESMPATCYSKTNSPALVPGTSIPLYTKGHNPAVRYDNVSSTSLCGNDVPLDTAHFDPANLPAFSYVVPNQCNDMHTMPTTSSCPRWDGGTDVGGDPVALADAWLARFVPLVAGSATVVVTWDEGSGGSQRVPTVLYGLGVAHGVDQTRYDHFSLEAGLYSHFGVAPVPGRGALAVPLPLPQVSNAPPTAAFTWSCASLTCNVDASGSNDVDGQIVNYSWQFGDSGVGIGVMTSHDYLRAGTYDVTLTVSDDSGAATSVTHAVTATVVTRAISFVGAGSFNGNVAKATVSIPAAVQPGDAILLMAAANNSSITASAPSGASWILVQSVSNGNAITRIYAKVASAGDAGSTVAITTSAIEKLDVQLVAYRGTAATPVAAVGATSEGVMSTNHTTSTVTVADAGSWVVWFWDDKSSTTTSWTAPGGLVKRAGSIGTGSAAMSSLVADSGASLTTGSVGGVTATTNDAVKATTATLILAPAG